MATTVVSSLSRYRAAAGLCLLVLGPACVSQNRVPDYIPRTPPRPERIDVVGGLLGSEIIPVPTVMLGPVIYDLPVVANSWVQAELNFLVNDRRETLEHWMQRGSYYRDFVTAVFQEYGIPTDLYHLGMIESGYIPTARSVAGAVGMWQFMPATSRDVNLRVDGVVDERMDPVRSTRAAARHLRSLYRIHGDWDLAAAAYNAGSTRISRGLQRFGAADFWHLAQVGDLAAETQHYVPRLYAMTIVGKDPQRFGFTPPAPSEAFAFDSIHVDRSLPLTELGSMTGLSAERLTAMNPHLRQGVTPEGGYWVWVPAGTGQTAQREYLAAASRTGEYVVRRGDNLSSIAQRAGVPSARIREMNPRVNFDRLPIGAVLQLPADGAVRLASASGSSAPERTGAPSDVALASVGRVPAKPEVYRVRSGDTLSEIAVEYGVSVRAIQAANDLSGTTIRAGQQLTIPATESSEARPLEHVVVAGDTLWELARRYGSSIDAIRDANGLDEVQIVPGQRLTVPTTNR